MNDSASNKLAKPTWQHVIDAVVRQGGCATVKDIEGYFREIVPERRITNVRPDATMLAVNAPSRIHFGQGKQTRRTDTGHSHDKRFLRPDKAFELYDPARHGVWEIARDSSGTFRIGQVRDATDPEISGLTGPLSAVAVGVVQGDVEDEPIGSRFALEAHLRDYLAQNLHTLSGLPNRVALYRDASGTPGVEFRTDIGNIDLLARGEDGSFYVLELKLGRGSDVALGQLMRYVGWVKRHIAGDAQVWGVIVAAEISDRLRYAASTASNVILLSYELQFSVRPEAL